MHSGYSILVPGAGAPAGINTIKALKMAKHKNKIIATDSDKLSAGFFMADDHFVMPKADDVSFVDALFGLVKERNVGILMPSSGFDIYPYSKNKKQLEDLGAIAVVSDEGALEICRDKLLTFTTLSGKYELPVTTTDPNKVAAFPVIAKPRSGKGSRGVFKVDNQRDLDYVTSKYADMIFQEYLPGQEYTVDVLCDLHKNPIIAVPRLRLQTKEGISTEGKIVRNAKLEEECMNIAKSIGIRGPCCIQMKEAQEGETKLVEVNARMGGGTIFTTLAGANFPSMIIDMVEGKSIAIPTVSEITVIRYFEELVITAKKGSVDIQ